MSAHAHTHTHTPISYVPNTIQYVQPKRDPSGRGYSTSVRLDWFRYGKKQSEEEHTGSTEHGNWDMVVDTANSVYRYSDPAQGESLSQQPPRTHWHLPACMACERLCWIRQPLPPLSLSVSVLCPIRPSTACPTILCSNHCEDKTRRVMTRSGVRSRRG